MNLNELKQTFTPVATMEQAAFFMTGIAYALEYYGVFSDKEVEEQAREMFMAWCDENGIDKIFDY